MSILQLSKFVQPQLLIGATRQTPQNLAPGADRLESLAKIVTYLNHLITRIETGEMTLERVLKFKSEIPMGSYVTIGPSSGRLRATLTPDAEDQVAFNADRVGLALLDGRRRSLAEMITLETAEETPAYGRILAALAAGTSERQVKAIARRFGVTLDRDLLSDLVREGAIDVLPAPPLPARTPGGADRVTWLGHAALMFQSREHCIWVDPCLRPKIEWRPHESHLFSETYADSLLCDNYGPSFNQIPMQDLPRPDAVLITHQDSDHFDLGLLLLLPDEVPIIVPANDGSRPWDVDLGSVIASVVGPRRRVLTLGHGESFRLGATVVSAFPFSGEMPHAMDHRWNCYLIETPTSTVAITADSDFGGAQAEYLARACRRKKSPIALFSSAVAYLDNQHCGWREGYYVHNFVRLWGWYARGVDLFRSDPKSHTSPYEVLRDLKKEIPLKHVFPYAMGSTPACRITEEPLAMRIGSLDLKRYQTIKAKLQSIDLDIPDIRYGRPWILPLAVASGAREPVEMGATA